MDLLSQYNDPDDKPKKDSIKRTKINIAPGTEKIDIVSNYEIPEKREILHNPDFDSMWGAVSGPIHPELSRASLENGKNNTITGFVQDISIDRFAFEEQMYNFNTKGYNLDPSGRNYVYSSKTVISENSDEKKEKKKKKKVW